MAPDVKMVRPKKVANDLKINLAPLKMMVFFVEKNDITFRLWWFTKITCAINFSTKNGCLSTNQSAIREALTIFSRLPSWRWLHECMPRLHYKLPYCSQDPRTINEFLKTFYCLLICGMYCSNQFDWLESPWKWNLEFVFGSGE